MSPPTGRDQTCRILFCDSKLSHRGAAHEVGKHAGWDVLCLDDEGEVQTRMKYYDCQVLVVVAHQQPYRALGLLKKVADERPGILRILISGHLTPASSARALEVAHQTLPDTASGVEICAAIEYALKIEGLVNKSAIRDYISGLGRLPTLPTVYRELNEALNSDVADAKNIASIIEQDPAIAAKIMQLVNSALFGLRRQISRIDEAVTIIGVRMIRDLLLATHLFSRFRQRDTWTAFSFSKLHQRSMLVARLAQQLGADAGLDRNQQGQAFLAGLLHDFGISVLANKDPEAYQTLMGEAVRLGQPMYAMEKMRLGLTHAEAAAYLLGMWNLPFSVVEAVLLHHFPAASPSSRFEPLTAVHLADALLPALVNGPGADLSCKLSESYLERLGIAKNLSRWQMMANEYRLKLEPGPVSR
ncbi:HDOD domain-containing protein [Marinobacterium rhizophilum]|uniref:HDOD domain-containing protein n=1 Tax=Marinobacterium rhizophilum TaxID=420402 RepID=UPI000363D267|nr:HDOD domain-containing protein [Marinobacterium rhizophilum]